MRNPRYTDLQTFLTDFPQFEDLAEEYDDLEEFLEDYPEMEDFISTDYVDMDTSEEYGYLNEKEQEEFEELYDDFPELDYLDNLNDYFDDESEWYAER